MIKDKIRKSDYMEKRKQVSPGEIYRHFKGNLYQIIAVGEHTETEEIMVVYQALYTPFKIYIRPYSQFVSYVDKDKYPQVFQEKRFQLQDFSEEMATIEKKEDQQEIVSNEVVENSSKEEKHDINDVFMNFLDAGTYKEKLEVLLEMENQLDNRLLNNLAASLDLSLEEGTLEERFEILKFHLQTYAKFECKRLR